MMKATKPTDEEILSELKSRGATMTYVLRNILSCKHAYLETAFVRRRLMALEKVGKVCRAPTCYKTQICWALSKLPADRDAGDAERGNK